MILQKNYKKVTEKFEEVPLLKTAILFEPLAEEDKEYFAEFKDLTIGKLNLLEDVASVSATLPKQVDDKIESLEMQIAGLNVSKNVETTSYDDSALIERIEKLNEDTAAIAADIKEIFKKSK